MAQKACGQGWALWRSKRRGRAKDGQCCVGGGGESACSSGGSVAKEEGGGPCGIHELKPPSHIGCFIH